MGGHEVMSKQAVKSNESHSDQHQIDIGTYHVYQGTTVTAELMVEQDPNHPNDAQYRIEHWGLYSSYQMPSSTLAAQALQFHYVRTDYGGSSADFRAHLRTITGVRYIQA